MREIELVVAALLVGTLITAVVVGAAVAAHRDGAAALGLAFFGRPDDGAQGRGASQRAG